MMSLVNERLLIVFSWCACDIPNMRVFVHHYTETYYCIVIVQWGFFFNSFFGGNK